MQLIHVKFEPKMKQQVEELCKQYHFANTSEFIRDSVRKNIEAYETKMAVDILNRNFRKGIGRRPTREERAQAVDELLKLKGL